MNLTLTQACRMSEVSLTAELHSNVPKTLMIMVCKFKRFTFSVIKSVITHNVIFRDSTIQEYEFYRGVQSELIKSIVS